jgi:hypothetical protein
MAINPYTAPDLGSLGTIGGLGAVQLVQWTLANGDSGKPFPLPNGYSVDVHIGGTIGVGGSVTLLGSSLPSDLAVEASASGGSWATVADSQGNAMTKTAASNEALVEQPLFVAPDCTAGDETTAIKVTLVLRKRL